MRENLEVVRRLHPGTPPQAVAGIIERLGLGTYADRRAGTLSLGNAQRLGLAKALLHNPELLLLDEPANGLDPAGIVEIRDLLLELARRAGRDGLHVQPHPGRGRPRWRSASASSTRGGCSRSWTSTSWSATGAGAWWCARVTRRAGMAVLAGAGLPRPPGRRPARNHRCGRDRTARRDRRSWCRAGHPPTMLRVEQEDLEQLLSAPGGHGRGRRMNNLLQASASRAAQGAPLQGAAVHGAGAGHGAAGGRLLHDRDEGSRAGAAHGHDQRQGADRRRRGRLADLPGPAGAGGGHRRLHGVQHHRQLGVWPRVFRPARSRTCWRCRRRARPSCWRSSWCVSCGGCCWRCWFTGWAWWSARWWGCRRCRLR